MTRRDETPSDRPLVVLDGGPRGRRWYWADDWAEMRRIAQWELDLRSAVDPQADDRCPPGDVLRYWETDETRAHVEPTRFGPGRVWAWRRRPVDE